MNHAHVEERLSSYLEGDMSERETADVERHLISCPECSSLAEALTEARKALAAIPELEPSPALLRRLHAIPKLKRYRIRLEFLLRPSFQPIFAGAAIILMFISFLVYSPGGKTLQKNINRQIHVGYSKIERLYAKAGALTDEIGDRKNIIIDSLKTPKPQKRVEKA